MIDLPITEYRISCYGARKGAKAARLSGSERKQLDLEGKELWILIYEHRDILDVDFFQ